MHIGLVEPLKQPASFRMTYNGKEFFRSQEFAAGEKPKVTAAQPRVPGEGLIFMLVGDREIPMGSARFSAENVADLLIADAKALAEQKKYRQARSARRKAIHWLETVGDSVKLADSYTHVCFDLWFARGRKAGKHQRQVEALAWYEKAIAMFDRLGEKATLSGNLSNLSVLYVRLGDKETALERALRGLELQKELSEPNDESIAAWTHAAGCHLELGQLNEADAVIQNGIERFGADTPTCGYLYGLQARVFDERAKRCRQKAKEILPPDHCQI